MTANYRTMYDALDPRGIPATAEMVAGYPDDGWTPEDFAAFPKAAHVRIANMYPDWKFCSVADIETGALTVGSARQFVVQRNAFRHGTATIYCDLSNLPYVQKACRGLSYNLWLASWTWQVPTAEVLASYESKLIPGVTLVAVQYASYPAYDPSLVIDPDWHKQPAAA